MKRPLTFCLGILFSALVVLRDVSGAVALGGLGLLLTYAAVRSFRDPTGAAVSVRAGQAGRIGAFICMGSLILFVVLRTLPLFLKFGILP